MEIHSYRGSLDPLWNSTTMVGVHSYGIPQLVQTDDGVEITNRYTSRRLANQPRNRRASRTLPYLVWQNNRHPYWSLKDLTPHEKF
jgi:hypothetical protein